MNTHQPRKRGKSRGPLDFHLADGLNRRTLLVINILQTWLENCVLSQYMRALEYKTPIGHLVMVDPNSQGDNYHIFIDNDYQGNIVRLKGHWVGNLDQNSDLTIDEVNLLGYIIIEKLAPAV